VNAADANFVAVVAYKALALVVGLAFAWMGYRLFVLGITEKSGDMELKGGSLFGIKITRAAPGTFFAVLGAAIVIYAVTQILQFSQTQATPARSSNTVVAPKGDSARQPPDTTKITTTTICDTCPAPTSPKHSTVGPALCDTCKPRTPARAPQRGRPLPHNP